MSLASVAAISLPLTSCISICIRKHPDTPTFYQHEWMGEHSLAHAAFMHIHTFNIYVPKSTTQHNIHQLMTCKRRWVLVSIELQQMHNICCCENITYSIHICQRLRRCSGRHDADAMEAPHNQTQTPTQCVVCACLLTMNSDNSIGSSRIIFFRVCLFYDIIIKRRA